MVAESTPEGLDQKLSSAEGGEVLSRKRLFMYYMIGCGYPMIVILIELFFGLCAQELFDPMPTIWHTIGVLLVPLSNGLLCYQLDTGRLSQHLQKLRWLGAISIGISAFYTIIFLPLIPLSLIAILFMGIGLLPLAPLVSFVMAIILYRRLLKSAAQADQKKPVKSVVWKGASLVLLVLTLLDVPAAATNLGIYWAEQNDRALHNQGISLLRQLGDEELLLRLCYSRSGAANGPLSFFASILRINQGNASTEQIREIYYEVTGNPFNSLPLPKVSQRQQDFSQWRFDADQGGTRIGGRIEGLNLIGSRLDGSIASDEGVAYLEWTLTFENQSQRNREARLQIALPNHSVVSRATLWVNGEEREAAFAGKGKVREAYQNVVRTQRDPLLVTTNGSNRVMAQAFPIAPDGGKIKFRLGITVPLSLISREQTSMFLPSIVDRNFSIDGDFSHALWIESAQSIYGVIRGGQPVSGDAARTNATELPAGDYRLETQLSDKALSQLHYQIVAEHDVQAPDRFVLLKPIVATQGAETAVETGSDANTSAERNSDSASAAFMISQRVLPVESNTYLSPLMLVIDGSVHTDTVKGEIIAALDSIAEGRIVGLILAGNQQIEIEPAPWTPSHAKLVKAAIAEYSFLGGQDNTYALASAMKASVFAQAAGTVLWIHAPQPVAFTQNQVLLEQAVERLQSSLPSIKLFSLKSGPNRLLYQSPVAVWTENVQRQSSVKDDLTQFFSGVSRSGEQFSFVREKVSVSDMSVNQDNAVSVVAGSEHIARLWAHEEIYRLIKSDPTENRSAALALAAQYQLVTPVSGAVVLENAQQYQRNDLTPVDAQSVPTIPEPHQWLLIISVLLILLWYFKRNPLPLIRAH